MSQNDQPPVSHKKSEHQKQIKEAKKKEKNMTNSKQTNINNNNNNKKKNAQLKTTIATNSIFDFDFVFLGSPQFCPTNDDAPLFELLRNKGFSARAFDWKDVFQQIKDSLFSSSSSVSSATTKLLIVMRSPWDYTQHIEQMHDFLTLLEEHDISILNPLPILRATMDKSYLLPNSSLGLIPSEHQIDSAFAPKGTAISQCCDLVSKRGWSDVVVKPLAGSFGTGVLGLKASELAAKGFATSVKGKHLRNVLEKQDCILQRQCHSIKTQGETSVVFIGSKMSHAVTKVPCANSLTVQGGKITPCTPTSSQLQVCQKILHKVKQVSPFQSPLYFRIDLVQTDDLKGLKVMELEAFDPELFFRFSSTGCQMAVDFIVDWAVSTKKLQTKKRGADELLREKSQPVENFEKTDEKDNSDLEK